MTKSNTVRSAVSIAAATLATTALASEATGTEAVGQMPVTGGMIAMIVGGLAVMGIVIYVLVQFLSK